MSSKTINGQKQLSRSYLAGPNTLPPPNDILTHYAGNRGGLKRVQLEGVGLGHVAVPHRGVDRAVGGGVQLGRGVALGDGHLVLARLGGGGGALGGLGSRLLLVGLQERGEWAAAEGSEN